MDTFFARKASASGARFILIFDHGDGAAARGLAPAVRDLLSQPESSKNERILSGPASSARITESRMNSFDLGLCRLFKRGMKSFQLLCLFCAVVSLVHGSEFIDQERVAAVDATLDKIRTNPKTEAFIDGLKREVKPLSIACARNIGMIHREFAVLVELSEKGDPADQWGVWSEHCAAIRALAEATEPLMADYMASFRDLYSRYNAKIPANWEASQKRTLELVAAAARLGKAASAVWPAAMKREGTDLIEAYGKVGSSFEAMEAQFTAYGQGVSVLQGKVDEFIRQQGK